MKNCRKTITKKWLESINACEDGSFVREHKCYHDEGLPCDAPVRIWEKV